jgi:hypothetical protein
MQSAMWADELEAGADEGVESVVDPHATAIVAAAISIAAGLHLLENERSASF